MKAELLLPIPQNFIRYKLGDTTGTIPIESLSTEEIQEYAERVKNQLLSSYYEKKNKPKTN